MPTYTTAVPSALPPEAAFAYMARFENLPEWDPSASESRSSGDPAPGTTYDVRVRFGKGEQQLRYVVRDYDPPRRVVLVADAPRFRSTDTITVAPDGNGSVVTYDAVIDLKGLMKLFSPIVAGRFRAAGDAAAAGMRRALNPA